MQPAAESISHCWTRPAAAAARPLMAALNRRLLAITGDDGRSGFDTHRFDPDKDAFLLLCSMEKPLACGVILRVDDTMAEIKRMYTRIPGLGVQVLQLLETRAMAMGYRRLRLSTRRINCRAVNFYRKHGYAESPPYGRYSDRPASICFEKCLRPDNAVGRVAPKQC